MKRDALAAQAKKQSAAAPHAVTVGEAWSAYLETRRPQWGERHYKDHESLSKAGGEVAKRGTRGRGVTIAGPLHCLNTKWRGLAIRDKVEGKRVIPLTPYVSHLLHALPRRNEWVFSSLTAAGGVLTIPRKQHGEACTVAGIDGLTLHGLRRSFKSLTEWLEIPAGVVAQVMGHKPSATAEKHYTVRPLDLLRVHHEKIEAWILEQAGIVFDAKAAPGALRVVAGRPPHHQQCSTCRNSYECVPYTQMTSGDLIREMQRAGWRLDRVNGLHHIYKHPDRPGHVVVPHPKKDLGRAGQSHPAAGRYLKGLHHALPHHY